jgi:hypothetical protein
LYERIWWCQACLVEQVQETYGLEIEPAALVTTSSPLLDLSPTS